MKTIFKQNYLVSIYCINWKYFWTFHGPTRNILSISLNWTLNLFLGYGLDDGIDGDETFGNDDNLSPLQRLEKYMESENVYTR